MMRMKLFLIGSLAAVLLSLTSATRALADDPPPTKLAVINIVQVFSSLNEKIASDAEIEAMRKDMNEQGRKMQEELETLSKQFSDNPPYKEGTPEYKAMQDDILDKSMKLEVFRQVSEQKLLFEQRNRTIMIYNAMNAEISQFSKANGIGFVFVIDDADFTSAKTTQDVLSRITVRKIMYAAPPYDITKRIIEEMNTKYQLPPEKKAP